jgi:hypothetical protein
LTARNDSLVAAATQQAASAGGGANPQAIFAAIRPTLEAARDGYRATRDSVRTVLTPEQWGKLPDEIRNPQQRNPRRELRNQRRERQQTPPG